jgi:hypothetical protein
VDYQSSGVSVLLLGVSDLEVAVQRGHDSQAGLPLVRSCEASDEPPVLSDEILDAVECEQPRSLISISLDWDGEVGHRAIVYAASLGIPGHIVTIGASSDTLRGQGADGAVTTAQELSRRIGRDVIAPPQGINRAPERAPRLERVAASAEGAGRRIRTGVRGDKHLDELTCFLIGHRNLEYGAASVRVE